MAIMRIEETVLAQSNIATLPRLITSLHDDLENRNGVNQKLFDALHDELRGYKDGFLLEVLHRPLIRDLIVLYDDLSELHRRTAAFLSGFAPGVDNPEAAAARTQLLLLTTNLDHIVDSLLEVLARMDVRRLEPLTGKLDKVRQRVVNVEPADSPAGSYRGRQPQARLPLARAHRPGRGGHRKEVASRKRLAHRPFHLSLVSKKEHGMQLAPQLKPTSHPPMPENTTSRKHRKAVGIDLGTTFSAIAHIDAYGKPQIIPNSESERITPSVILFDAPMPSSARMAKQNAVAEPEKIVDFVKREMGKSKSDFYREFNSKNIPPRSSPRSSSRSSRTTREKYLGEPVTDAVITVPAYFNDAERTATLHAGQLAGLNVLQIINEPTAAALAYGLDKLDSDQTVFVFDLGGGTFDVTIMRIEDHHIRMLASNGDHRLGGKDWDDVIVNWVADEFDKIHGENPLLDLQSYQDLYNRALAAKIQLTSRTIDDDRPQLQRQEREARDDPRRVRKALPPPAREVQDDLRDRDAGGEAELGGDRPHPAHRRHDAACLPCATMIQQISETSQLPRT